MSDSKALSFNWLASLLRNDLASSLPEMAPLLSAAEWHGVGPLAWHRLNEDPSTAAAVRDALDAPVRAAVTRELLEQRELTRVLDALHSAGARVLVVKGTALAYTVYPQAWLRPRLDTDLYVHPEDRSSAVETLAGCGYARFDAISTGEFVNQQVVFTRRDPIGARHVLDVHWKLSNPQMVADSLQFDRLWPGVVPVALGEHARVPMAAHSLVLACVHRLAHHQGDERLVWLYDILLLARSLDADGWREASRVASDGGVASLVLDGLRRARQVLGAPVPEQVEASLDTSSAREPARRYLTKRIKRRHVLVSDLHALQSWRARGRLLREHLFPPRTFMRQRYGEATRWPLSALYVHRIVTGAVNWVRR